MTKFCIKSLIIGAILIVIGTVMLSVGIFSGIFSGLSDIPIGKHASSAEYAVTTMTVTGFTETGAPIQVFDDVTYTSYGYSSELDVSPEEVQELDISISTGSFYIVPGDSFILYADGIAADYLKFGVNNGCLEVNYSPNFKLSELDYWLSASPEIMLYVPFKTYEKVSINMSAGTANINEITTNDFVFDMSAGDAYLGNVIAYNSSDIKMSAGNTIFTDCVFTNSNSIKVSAGEMVFENCSLTGKNYMKVTAGDLQMYLNENSAYYDISANKSTGTLYINDEEVNNSYSATSTLEYPLGTMNVDVRAGSCYIVFDED